MVKENKKKVKKENKTVDKKENSEKDNSISFNFSMKMNKDGMNGNISCNPPKEMSEEDKASMERLMKQSIQTANMFMANARNEMMREQKNTEKMILPNLFDDIMRRERNYRKYNRFGF